ncbi:MAG: hypothetical protein LAQ30_24590, partial [Acidobacteriia bacterium]|nr:hypothetical protein [Terriglobia bacterium]
MSACASSARLPILASIAAVIALSTPCGAQPGYIISTLAGSLNNAGPSGDGGAATDAQLNFPTGVAVDGSFSVYIADNKNNRIRQVQAGSGTITTLAGNGNAALFGDGGSAATASLFFPSGVAVASNGDYYIADWGNNSVRKVSKTTISTYAGSPSAQPGFSGDNGQATSALLSNPAAVALDSQGNLYIADWGNNRIRKVDTSGKITTVAGADNTGLGDGGKATSARLNGPRAVAVDLAGNLYIADTGQNRIRKVDTTGIITTLAGTGTNGFSGDGGPAVGATLGNPRGVAVDAIGNVFIADYFNNRIRRVAPNGTISTIAGTAHPDIIGDGGPATSAGFSQPMGLAVDGGGAIYIADFQHQVVRKLTPILPTIGGVITAGDFGAYQSAMAPGSWIEIYGSNFAAGPRGWAAADFTGSTAPTALDGTAVTIGGQAAFVDYVSPGQVDALIPSNAPLGQQQISVRSLVGSSASFPATISASQPGFYAPPVFKIGGKQYAGALFPDNTTFAVPAGAVSGVPSRAAKPGDTITLYGGGFGPVLPDTPAGQPAPARTSLVTTLQVFFGTSAGNVTYQGLSPGSY